MFVSLLPLPSSSSTSLSRLLRDSSRLRARQKQEKNVRGVQEPRQRLLVRAAHGRRTRNNGVLAGPWYGQCWQMLPHYQCSRCCRINVGTGEVQQSCNHHTLLLTESGLPCSQRLTDYLARYVYSPGSASWRNFHCCSSLYDIAAAFALRRTWISIPLRWFLFIKLHAENCWLFLVLQLSNLAHHPKVSPGKQRNRQTCGTIRPPCRCHHQHGWHGAVRSSCCYIYCPGQWIWFGFGTNYNDKVNVSLRLPNYFSLFIFIDIITISLTFPVWQRSCYCTEQTLLESWGIGKGAACTSPLRCAPGKAQALHPQNLLQNQRLCL